MKRYFFTLFLWFLVQQLWAQEEFMSLDLSLSKLRSAASNRDASGNMLFAFQGGHSIQVIALNNNFQKTDDLTVQANEITRKDMLLGSVLGSEKITLFFYNQRSRVYSALQISRAQKTSYFTKLGYFNANRHLLKAIALPKGFCLLSIPKHENALWVTIYDEELQKKEQRFDIDMPTLYARLSSRNNELQDEAESAVGIDLIRYEVENTVRNTHATKKMYVIGNQVFLSFDEPSQTHLVQLDLERMVSSYRKLNFALDKNLQAVPKQGNSFMLGKQLYRATMSKEQLNLSIIDADSMRLINSYNLYRIADKNNLANTPMVQETTGRDDRLVKHTSDYFNKVLDGKLCIAVNRLSDTTVDVHLGAYDENVVYRNSGWNNSGLNIGFGVGMGVGFGSPYGFGYPGMGYGYPGYSYPYSSPSYSTTVTDVVYFRSMLYGPGQEHISGDIPTGLAKRVKDYQSTLFRNGYPELMTYTPSSDGLLFGYFSKVRNKYVLMRFQK